MKLESVSTAPPANAQKKDEENPAHGDREAEAKIGAPGNYMVETEEEQLDAVLAPVWKRTLTIMRLKKGITTGYQPIDPEELHEALMRDGAQEHSALPPSASPVKGHHDRARTVRRKKF